MCKYCDTNNDNRNQYTIINKSGKFFHSPAEIQLVLDIEDTAETGSNSEMCAMLCIDHSVIEPIPSLQIKFCPMCGRKL